MKRMTIDQLARLERLSAGESPMLRVSLHNIADADAIRKQLQTEFAKSLKGKEGFDGLTGRLQKVVTMSADRAARIARTEKTRAANGGRYASIINEYIDDYNKAKAQHGKRPALPKVQWVHTNEAKMPRASHIALSGQTREIGEEFMPSLHYPGDPEAPPRETINCHCYIRRAGGNE